MDGKFDMHTLEFIVKKDDYCSVKIERIRRRQTKRSGVEII